jgi:hypothetical protein
VETVQPQWLALALALALAQAQAALFRALRLPQAALDQAKHPQQEQEVLSAKGAYLSVLPA